MKTEYYDCACFSPDHTLRFSYFEDDDQTPPYLDIPELCLEVQLNNRYNIFIRIWKAIKYIFGYKCQYGHWDCWLLKIEDVDKMIEMLTKFKTRHEKFANKNQKI